MSFEKIRDLTTEEIAAARQYTSASRRWHHVMQGLDSLDSPHFEAELSPIFEGLPRLVGATKCYRLREPLKLHAGLANGYSALGNLWDNDPSRFVDLEFTYSGVFSTSVHLEIATNFLVTGNNFRPVLLSIDARPGLLGLPTSVLGNDNTHEGEVVVAAGTRFRITRADRVLSDVTPYVHLRLTSLA